jgi:ubiquinol-cytochrome c reductase iron-sulfur subunit
MNPSVDPSVVDKERRTWVAIACGAGAAGGIAAAVPFAMSFAPSERARAAGAAVEADISALRPGEMMTVEWRGQPVWIVHRTPEQIASLERTNALVVDPQSARTAYPTPEYARNVHRSIKPEFLVVVGICTHLGCSPTPRMTAGAQPNLPDDWPGGFFCPCHGSSFDMAARVFRNMPAPDNLPVPPHMYLSDTKILIGEDAAA